MLWGGRRGQGTIVATEPTECPMPQANDSSRCLLTLEQDSTLIAVVELSQASWLVAGIVPAVERQPLKKIEADEAALLRLLGRWTDEATRAGRAITRVCVAFEAGCDGFWLARWLRARGIEAHVIHPTSVAVSREHQTSQPISSSGNGPRARTPPISPRAWRCRARLSTFSRSRCQVSPRPSCTSSALSRCCASSIFGWARSPSWLWSQCRYLRSGSAASACA